MTEDKFLSLMVSDKVVVKTIHEQNMATFFATINSLLDGDDVPWPTFEKDTFSIAELLANPIATYISPETVDCCGNNQDWKCYTDRRPSAFFKENKKKILDVFKKVDDLSNAHGDVITLIEFLDSKGWLNNAQSLWGHGYTGIEAMGFHITTKFMVFSLSVLKEGDTLTWTPSKRWYEPKTVHAEFCFDPKGLEDGWHRSCFRGVLPLQNRVRGCTIQDVLYTLEYLNTPKGYKTLYDKHRGGSRSYFE
ncbi:MAG: hypothetical protein J6Y37_14880 [Paludibacteraceae bacterium]|nr:hypothetical protein [Paludibacteraceae bacterium]